MADATSPSPADDQWSLASEQETEALTEEQIAELKEAYCLLTREWEGPVTSRKLGRVLRLTGINPSEKELNDMMVQIDPKGKGTVDFAEFVKAMTRRTLDVHCEEQLREAFRVLDKDGDGYLSVGELRHVLTTRGDKLTAQEVNDMVRQLDSAGLGKISCDDFVKVVTL